MAPRLRPSSVTFPGPLLSAVAVDLSPAAVIHSASPRAPFPPAPLAPTVTLVPFVPTPMGARAVVPAIASVSSSVLSVPPSILIIPSIPIAAVPIVLLRPLPVTARPLRADPPMTPVSPITAQVAACIAGTPLFTIAPATSRLSTSVVHTLLSPVVVVAASVATAAPVGASVVSITTTLALLPAMAIIMARRPIPVSATPHPRILSPLFTSCPGVYARLLDTLHDHRIAVFSSGIAPSVPPLPSLASSSSSSFCSFLYPRRPIPVVV